MEVVSLPATLRVGRGRVSCAAVRGARLAAGAGDGALRLWRWRRGAGWRPAGEHARAHRYGVTAAQFARSGLLLATAGVDGVACVWAARELLQRRRVLAAPGAAAARGACWATDERVCVGHDDGALRVWHVRAATLLAHVRAHDAALHAVAAFAQDALLLTACTDGVVKVYDFEEVCAHGCGGAGPAPLQQADGAHDLGALSGCGWERGAATGGRDALVRVWRVRGAGRARRVAAAAALAGHSAAVAALASARGVLASAALDRTARLWAPRSGACLAVLHAHTSYLTAVALAHDLRYLITGSNDKSLRMWSLGSFSLEDDLEPACSPLTHFGLGDLEGIGPVDEEAVAESAGSDGSSLASLEAGLARLEARLVCRALHAAAVNCVAASGQWLATASSDGMVRVFRWCAAADEESMLVLKHELSGHAYPALAVDFDSSGDVLLSAGLDGCARLWDVQSGCELAVLSAAGLGEADGGGGGGVRDARVSPLPVPHLLLASDDGLAAIWGLHPLTPEPLHVYASLSDAATCCAWARGDAGACGTAAGELLLLAPPPRAALLASRSDAHDLGVLSCDFNPSVEKSNEEEGSVSHLLATGGRDGHLKLWWADVNLDGGRLKEALSIAAHESSVQCVRWGKAGNVLTSGGDDRWARVWGVELIKDQLEVRALFAVPTDAGGAPAVCLLGDLSAPYLAVGTLSGSLTLWQLPENIELDESEGAEPRVWGTPGVIRWLREYVTRHPGGERSEEAAARLSRAARGAGMTGAQLLDAPLQELLLIFTEGPEDEDPIKEDEKDELLQRLQDEILWLRRDLLPDELEQSAPHALRCPLSHGVMREPARAADGYTYERQSFLHWRLASGGEELVSPMTARRLHSAAVAPNYGVRDALRRFLGWPQPQPQPQTASDDECEH